jgi:hypothetical protein
MMSKMKKTVKSEVAKKTPAPKVAAEAVTQGDVSTKKLSQIDAAVEVLGKASEPMTCKAMVEAMTAKDLWSSPNGKTPEATLYSAILREIATKGKDARFVKTAPGRFAAR